MKKILSVLLATALLLTGTLATDFAATKYTFKKVADVYGVYIAPDMNYTKITLTDKNITTQSRVSGAYQFTAIEKKLEFSNCNYFKVSSMKTSKDMTSVDVKFSDMNSPHVYTIIKAGKDSYSLKRIVLDGETGTPSTKTYKLIKFSNSKAADAYMTKDKSLVSVIAKEKKEVEDQKSNEAALAKETKVLNDSNKAKNSKLTSEGYFYNDYNAIFGEFQVEVPNEGSVGSIMISVLSKSVKSKSVPGEWLHPENDYTVEWITLVNDGGAIGYVFIPASVKFTKVAKGLEVTYSGALTNSIDGKKINETASLTLLLSDYNTIQSIACSEKIDVLNVSDIFIRKALSN